MGISFLTTVTNQPLSAEEQRKLLQMRNDSLSYKKIGAVLERDPGYLRKCFLEISPLTDGDAKLRQHPFARLTLDELRSIRTLRNELASWRSIGSRFPEYELSSIKEDFWRFTGRVLSSTDLLEIDGLRQEGKTWLAIANTGDFFHRSQNGIRQAYRRAREEQQLQLKPAHE